MCDWVCMACMAWDLVIGFERERDLRWRSVPEQQEEMSSCWPPRPQWSDSRKRQRHSKPFMSLFNFTERSMSNVIQSICPFVTSHHSKVPRPHIRFAATRMTRPALLLLIDGLGDVSVRELGDRTPLQVAQTPYLDALAGSRDDGLPLYSAIRCFSQWRQWFDGSSRAWHCMWQRYGTFVSSGIRPNDVRGVVHDSVLAF